MITVHSKDLLLINADSFTLYWWKVNHGLEMEPLEIKAKAPVKPFNPLPVENGFGTREDSIGSV